MSVHCAEVLWLRNGGDFPGNGYHRRHLLLFDGGLQVPGSSSPQVVPQPLSDASALDPKEAFVASLSSCQMLWFLSIATKRRLCVDRYFDAANGLTGKNAEGKTTTTVVTLRPDMQFSGDRQPTRSEPEQLHHEAHEAGFVANSVRTEERCEPVHGPD